MSSIDFQALPRELHREIAKWTHPREIMNLALTSKSFNQDFEPILYHTVVLRSRLQGQRLCRAIDADSECHLRHRCQIKHFGIVLPLYTDLPPVENILSICDNITDLFVLGDSAIFLQEMGHLLEGRAEAGQIHVSRLSLDVLEFCGPQKGPTHADFDGGVDIPGPLPRLFSGLTHLDVRTAVATDDWDHWAGLAALPALTHLGFHVSRGQPAPVQIMKGALAQCTTLRVLILFHPGTGGKDCDDVDMDDSRFCLRQYLSAIPLHIIEPDPAFVNTTMPSVTIIQASLNKTASWKTCRTNVQLTAACQTESTAKDKATSKKQAGQDRLVAIEDQQQRHTAYAATAHHPVDRPLGPLSSKIHDIPREGEDAPYASGGESKTDQDSDGYPQPESGEEDPSDESDTEDDDITSDSAETKKQKKRKPSRGRGRSFQKSARPQKRPVQTSKPSKKPEKTLSKKSGFAPDDQKLHFKSKANTPAPEDDSMRRSNSLKAVIPKGARSTRRERQMGPQGSSARHFQFTGYGNNVVEAYLDQTGDDSESEDEEMEPADDSAIPPVAGPAFAATDDSSFQLLRNSASKPPRESRRLSSGALTAHKKGYNAISVKEVG
ncbi:hypothetical protein K438DRAFT_1749425 [Mycena galopus ATCC 62051]|nr:hypothetical protein K438DRAFT_1749425 [Mycena galopus ATCC 62051]